jgi:hypothetical protein
VLIAHAMAAGQAFMAHDSKKALTELIGAGASLLQVYQQQQAQVQVIIFMF